MIIYTIKNQVNGKQLIGQTISTINQRWSRHRCDARNGAHHNPHFQAAWNKYGEATFEFFVIDETAKNVDELNVLETFYIATTPNLYNLTSGGRNGSPSAETRRKISEARKGMTFTAEHRRKLSEARKGCPSYWKGKKRSVETRCKISAALKGKPLSVETRRKMSESRKGKTNKKVIGGKHGSV